MRFAGSGVNVSPTSAVDIASTGCLHERDGLAGCGVHVEGRAKYADRVRLDLALCGVLAPGDAQMFPHPGGETNLVFIEEDDSIGSASPVILVVE